MPTTNAPTKIKWKKSEAKNMLRVDLINGNVPADMAPMDVYKMRPEYAEFKYENFRTNLNNLRTAVAENITQMQRDSLYFGHDKAIMRHEMRNADEPRSRVWIETQASVLLKLDINEGLHEHLTPSELYQSREEYQEFPLQVFRNHIYQEVDSRTLYQESTSLSKEKVSITIQHIRMRPSR